MRAIDERFIEEICSKTWKQLYQFVYYKVQNREEAEDVTQETYYKAISYMQKNNVDMDRLSGFLRTISLNIIRDRWRKNKRRGTEINLEDINSQETAVDDCTDHFAQRQLIEDALNMLTEDQRTVIELRILKGYSVADTAKQMDKKETAVRVLQHRALKNLTKILKDEY